MATDDVGLATGGIDRETVRAFGDCGTSVAVGDPNVDDASFGTGTALPVDGGYLAK